MARAAALSHTRGLIAVHLHTRGDRPHAQHMQHARTALTAGTIGAIGDVLMQSREGADLPHNWDAERTERLVSFRCVHGPVIDASWRTMDAALRMRGIVGIRNTASLVLFDQCFLGPPSIFFFFLSQGALEGKSHEECLERARSSFLPTFKIGMPYWCLVHSLTFSVVPVHLRMAWASVAAVFWNAMISKQNQLAISRENEKDIGHTSSCSSSSSHGK